MNDEEVRYKAPPWGHECSLIGYKVARDVLVVLFIVALFIAVFTSPWRGLIFAISVPMTVLRVMHWYWHRKHR